jgi:hypothetical protein
LLLGVVRVGALRQRVEKGFAVLGKPPSKGGPAGVHIAAVPQKPGLWTAAPPLAWLGSYEARQDWAVRLSQALTAAAGGKTAVLPTGVSVRADGRPQTTPYGEDRHVLEVASAAEQEVLCDLLREHAAVLIALTGRSPHGDGSRRLAGSREHVTAWYLRSAAPAYLSRFEQSLRREHGLAGLDHMDVYPATEPDGTPTVVVRCVDAAASLASTRAHAVLLAAFALRAQRTVRDGNRIPETPHRKVDDDRARAVARGLRARLHVGGAKGQPGPQEARALLRGLLAETLAVELDNLEATAEELFPVIAAVDLPDAGLSRFAREDTLLSAWAGSDPAAFPGIAARVLTDHQPGGPCLALARQAAPGRTRLLLDEWTGVIGARHGADTAPRRPGGRPDGHRAPAGQQRGPQGGQPAGQPGRRKQTGGPKR